jgi:hypothetical protein
VDMIESEVGVGREIREADDDFGERVTFTSSFLRFVLLLTWSKRILLLPSIHVLGRRRVC